jgi:hypothetical protein
LENLIRLEEDIANAPINILQAFARLKTVVTPLEYLGLVNPCQDLEPYLSKINKDTIKAIAEIKSKSKSERVYLAQTTKKFVEIARADSDKRFPKNNVARSRFMASIFRSLGIVDGGYGTGNYRYFLVTDEILLTLKEQSDANKPIGILVDLYEIRRWIKDKHDAFVKQVESLCQTRSQQI